MESSTGSRDIRKTVIVGVIGNIMEWYDFALYGYFAPVLANLFFPSKDPAVSLISAFGVFATGFLMRPVGAAIFGHFGDRLGRRKALSASVLLMAIATALMGLLAHLFADRGDGRHPADVIETPSGYLSRR